MAKLECTLGCRCFAYEVVMLHFGGGKGGRIDNRKRLAMSQEAASGKDGAIKALV